LPQAGDVAPRLALVVGLIALVLAIGLWLAVDGDALLAKPAPTGSPSATADASGRVASGLRIGTTSASTPSAARSSRSRPARPARRRLRLRRDQHRVREYYAWLLALTAGMFGVFLARDVLLFYIFFEFTLVPLYFLIGIWAGRNAATPPTSSSSTLCRQRHHLRGHHVSGPAAPR